ncbi:glyoxal reductase isoform X2 [Nematostella vectensis]|uniref:glyoxal reductase isoform X2 n=1 Tax=Nematostella vectensis TaxID=45351 RepID=UPI00138FFA06|nr:glyoxal reductase isoform X2 [Nematostella vectensis]
MIEMRSTPDCDVIYEALDAALGCGYRLIDTAAVYRNEEDIGRSLKRLYTKYGLRRKDIFITSKLAPRDHGIDKAEKACLKSIQNLGCEYLDLYLIHWPGVQKLKSDDPKNAVLRTESWKALEKLSFAGHISSIGISNYTIGHIEELLGFANVTPALLQVEFHPRLYQTKLLEFCQSNTITLQAYTSLGQGKLLNESEVLQVACQHNVTPAQVLLKWALQHGVGVIPKSTNPKNITTNIDLSDLQLSAEDMALLDNLNSDLHFCWDPSRVL